MADLLKDSLAMRIISREDIRKIYEEGASLGIGPGALIDALCLSHERLREEVIGHDAMTEHDVRRFVELCTRLDEIVQLCDTGSEIHKAVFGAEASRLGFVGEDVVAPGWRVAETMRAKAQACLDWLNRWKKGA